MGSVLSFGDRKRNGYRDVSMRPRPSDRVFQQLAEIWLTVLVHLDALRAEPRAYVTAANWRILGKFVRARGQFAPLLGRSPHAYALCVLRDNRNLVGAARFAWELTALKRSLGTNEIFKYHHPYVSRASERFAVAL